MSSPLIAAGELFEREAARAASLLPAAAELKRVGSLQQAADEAQARLDAAKSEHAAITTQIENDKVTAAAAHTAALAEIEASKDASEKHIANRTAEAERIVSDAQSKAEKTMRDAQAEAGKIVDDANQAVASIKNRLGELSNAVNEKTNEIAALEVTIVDRKQVLDNINAQIAAVKAKF